MLTNAPMRDAPPVTGEANPVLEDAAPVPGRPAVIHQLDDREFRVVRQLLHEIAGISLTDAKRDLVRARLGKRVRALELSGFAAYVDYVRSDGGRAELAVMVDALTTNKTSFFREPVHFDFLRNAVLPELVRRGRPIRIWSAGCSTGEEPYSLAMLLHQHVRGLDDLGVRILATDISARTLAVARDAAYGDEKVRELPPELRKRYFVRRSGTGSGTLWEVHPRLRALVRIARLNLMGPWPMRAAFDVIFCRNVMIYFDQDTRVRLVRRFGEMLGAGGYLFVGHSESLTSFRHGLDYIQPAVYRK